MEFNLIALAALLGAFVVFSGLAILAVKRASTNAVAESSGAPDKPLQQCYECLGSSGLDKNSTAECASACGMPV